MMSECNQENSLRILSLYVLRKAQNLSILSTQRTCTYQHQVCQTQPKNDTLSEVHRCINSVRSRYQPRRRSLHTCHIDIMSLLRPQRPLMEFSGHHRRHRRLILHFDLRNTILVADSVTNVTVEHALNSFLTSATWGRETDNIWDWYTDKPSIVPPAPGLVISRRAQSITTFLVYAI